MARLALFVPELTAGGAQQALLTLCPHFVAAAGPVDLVLAYAAGELLERVPDGVRVVDLSAGRKPRTPLGLGLRATRSLVHYLRRERPETLLSTLTGANLVAVTARALARVPVRLVVREANTPDNLQHFWIRVMVRSLYPRADAVIAVSGATRDGLVEQASVAAERIETIFNPVDQKRLAQLAARPPDHPWFTPGSPPVIVTVGRLVPQKDHKTLIDAFALLRQDRDARLMLIGEGPLRGHLEAQIRRLDLGSDVELPGFFQNPYPSMAYAAVFALSSRWEGMPNVLLEALGLGTPVVATDCADGPAELLSDASVGTLVPVGDIDMLCLALHHTLSEPGSSTTRRQRAGDFAPERIAAQYLAALAI